MKAVSKVIAAVALVAAVSTPAYAWGPREQGVVAGIAGTLLYQHITQPRVYGAPPVAYPPQPMVPYYPGTVYQDYTYRPMYRAVDVFDTGCQCYRTVMVQIN